MTNYDDALDQLVNTLQKHQSILEFKDIEKKIKANPLYRQQVYQMKKNQQNAFLFNKVEKDRAEKMAISVATELKENIESQPIVEDYRNKLQNASDLLQYVTKTIEDKVNEEFIDEQS
ncbi:hypothetical protein DIX60_09930 [Streptococcus iniae]|uniref:YlbF family regulator n=1 Tax=Streptococcus iniae TaxID=1346 RepID=A0A1J0N204_STRIN|nr:YlbF family regulator [Streptococcus iniae]AGM99897.1 hypothetical protein K710_2156 [Streptococcus iniae SF1]AHY16740.1 hypothetical protein DQ08_09955 [Streptococcus iniae]AHY18605.1 hypothetical protein DW64_09940 [Streptococcus iniae]AJG26867.1 hypothetical protein SI82_09860 [Streptococcus iniae]APD32765.1 hypothetical protein BMF34_09895 [Streptococcus iniae]